MDRLDVEESRLQPIAVIVLGVIMVPLGVASLVSGLSDGLRPVPIVLGLGVLGLFGLTTWLARRGHARSVRRFTMDGLERHDGRRFAWTDLERVVYQVRMRQGSKRLWRTEIHFRDGEAAWLLPLRVANRDAVDALVQRLPCAHVEERV